MSTSIQFLGEQVLNKCTCAWFYRIGVVRKRNQQVKFLEIFDKISSHVVDVYEI